MFINVPGYEIIQIIYEGQKSAIYRAKKLSTIGRSEETYIIKAFKNPYNTPKHLASLQHELDVSKKINSEFVIKGLELIQTDANWVLVMQDFHGFTLSTIQKENNLDLATILGIAIGIAKGISDIHRQFIIHKDIKPQNVIVNIDKHKIKIIDFGISTLLSKETQSIINPEALEGSISYISPEQTGRMNRSIDYRSDIYSLGVTLYELLTGELPFHTTDLMELIYMHITKPIKPPHMVKNAIPLALSRIVAKCLEKEPENRYYSAHGLCNDLEKCLTQLTEKGFIEDFSPGLNDVYDRFSIPEKLYGREKELAILEAQIHTVSEGTALTLVTGYSGIGKSSVVLEMQRSGYFIVGKFDQLKKNSPFYAFILAFQSLINQLLAESSESVSMWKKEILEALGTNAQLLTELIPELELIIGTQKQTEKIDYKETEHRILVTFINFTKVFLNRPFYPLIIFLDDLQWADYSSLKLLFTLATEEGIKNLLIIGSYRSNEVDRTHPLTETINRILDEDKIIETIEINALSLHSLNQLVADVLHTDLEEAFELTNLVFKKTQGNPFFVKRFLTEMYKEGLITFNTKKQGWDTNIAKITKMTVTENVADLIGNSLKKMSPNSKDVLKVAAALGNVFEMYPICHVTGKSLEVVMEGIWDAIQAECIVPMQSFYSIDIQLRQNINFDNSPSFKFQHDRIQQAAYAMITEGERDNLHYSIGKTLMTELNPKKKEELFLNIVDHLNYGIDMLKTPEEKLEHVKINQTAGNIAINAIAYPAAQKYFKVCLDLLPKNAWESHYNLVFNIYQQYAMAIHLSGKPEVALDILNEMLANAKSDFDKATICLLKMEPLLSSTSIREAIDVGKEGVKYLGVPNFDLSHKQVVLQIILLKIRLLFTKPEDILNWPEATDEKTQLISSIYSRIATFGFFVNTNEFAVVCVRTLRMTLDKGVIPASITGFMGFALSMVNKPFYQFRKAYDLAKIIYRLGFKYIKDRSSFTARIYFLSRIARYGESFADIAPKLLEHIKLGANYGHVWVSRGPVYYTLTVNNFFAGMNLELLKNETVENIIKQLKNSVGGFIYLTLRWRQIYRLLRNEVAEYNDDSFYNFGPQPEILANITLKEKTIPVVIFGDTVACMLIDFYRKKFDAGIEKFYEMTKTYSGYFPGDYNWLVCNFYGGACLAGSLKKKHSKKALKALQKVIKYFEKCKSSFAPNFEHMYYILSSDMQFIKGDTEEAIRLATLAVQSAKNVRNPNFEAIAYEQLAFFYQMQNKILEQKLYITNAYETYFRWGCILKLQQMEREYPDICVGLSTKTPEIVKSESAISSFSLTKSTQNTDSTALSAKRELSFETFIKAAQALSEEIQLDKLVTKLMRLVILEAGAKKAFLILKDTNDNLVLEAKIYQYESNASLMGRERLETKKGELATHVVQYVARSMREVILADASKDNMFNKDPYIYQNNVHSILTLPLIYQGKLTGVIYLENSMIKGAFTKESFSLLNLLSSQIAISIENARFYAQLEEKVNQRTSELSEKNNELAQTLSELKNTQDQLVESEKLAALGQLIAGIAHEVNTPLGAVKASAENSRDAILSLKDNFDRCMDKMNANKKAAFMDLLRRSNGQDKQLSSKEMRILRLNHLNSYEKAVIPHAEEVMEMLLDMHIYDNLVGILTLFAEDALEIVTLAYNISALQNNNLNILQACEQQSKIIFALKAYIHGGEHKDAVIAADLSQGIDTVLMLYDHKLKDNITVIKNYAKIPNVLCRFNELNQVWTNIIHNAIQAIKQKGIIEIDIYSDGDAAIIKITDSGEGIPEEIQSRIFSPFFTTKPKGEGSGLGLSICKKIVEAHGGSIQFTSKPGATVFTVSLPLSAPHCILVKAKK